MATDRVPPRIPRRLLEGAVPPGAARDGLLGDLHELYVQRRQRQGRISADLWYWREACSAALRYRLAADGENGAADGRPAGFRGTGGGGMKGAWIQLVAELRPAVRRFYRNPGFTTAAVLPLAAGLGATATIFSLAHDVVLAPLPYPESNRVVVIRHVLPGFQGDGEVPEVGAFLGQLLHYRERSRLLTDVGGYWTFDGTLTGDEGAEYLHLGGVTAGLLNALGVRPVEGRLFEEDEPWPQTEGMGVTLLSHGFWVERYGGASSAVGRTITTQGWSHEVVGVLPPALPLASSRPVLWNAIPDQQARENPQWTVPALVGRLAPGATMEALQRELAALTAELPQRYPEATNIRNAVERGRMTPRVMPIREWIVGDVDGAIWLLFASVGLLLLVAFGNVVGLFLVRADASRHDHAVRLALGSGRRRAALRTLLESGIVIGTGAGLALVITNAGIGALVRWVPAEIPRAEAVAVGREEVAFLLALWLLGTVAVAALQLLHQRGDMVGALLQGGRGAAAAPARLRLRHAFVGLQIAVALVLMIGGGLILRSARSLGRVDPGFQVEGLLTFRIVFPFREIASGAAPGGATSFYQEVAAAVEALPGVEAAGWGTCVPLSLACGAGGFPIRPPEGSDPQRDDPVAGYVQVSQGYRSAVGMPLVAGRELRPEDHLDATNPVLVSESLARQLWPGRSPLGRTFTPSAFGSLAEPPPFTVVGVVGEVRFGDLRLQADPIVYAPPRTDVSMVSFAVRTTLPPVALLNPIRTAIRHIRPDIPLAFAETMEASVARETAAIRFSSLLVMLAAGATLLLSALGVYGVLAYVVGLRRPEFGIRLAMGATGGQLRRMVLVQGLITAGGGVAVGLVAAAGASSLLRSVLFGVAPVDPTTYALAAALLLLSAAGATYLPARRASRMDPTEALRGG